MNTPAPDGEWCPYLSKLDKGIAPDPLPRIPPFLPDRSFSTRATFPVRAASSSSWSLPMARDRGRPPLSTARLRSPHSPASARRGDSCSPLHTSGSSGGREGGKEKEKEEENHLLLLSLDRSWVECGREGGRRAALHRPRSLPGHPGLQGQPRPPAPEAGRGAVGRVGGQRPDGGRRGGPGGRLLGRRGRRAPGGCSLPSLPPPAPPNGRLRPLAAVRAAPPSGP